MIATQTYSYVFELTNTYMTEKNAGFVVNILILYDFLYATIINSDHRLRRFNCCLVASHCIL